MRERETVGVDITKAKQEYSEESVLCCVLKDKQHHKTNPKVTIPEHLTPLELGQTQLKYQIHHNYRFGNVVESAESREESCLLFSASSYTHGTPPNSTKELSLGFTLMHKTSRIYYQLNKLPTWWRLI